MTRLRTSSTAGPGLTRVRAGRGFSYRDLDGTTLRDAETRERVEALVIPPAWTQVWISPHPNGHIQAVGTDAAGRRQYLYHPAWRARMDALKFDRALVLAQSLPAARRGVTIDLRRDDLSAQRVLAGAFRMLDNGLLRVGSERYALEHGSFGLATLLCAHATVVGGDTVHLSFPAKSGQNWESDIIDLDLTALISRLKRRGGRARLLAWNEGGGWHLLRAADINNDVRRRTGGDFTAKDFRTLHGTAAAAISLARSGPASTRSARRRAVSRAIADAAAMLGNTPAIARSSYVDPRIIDLYEARVTIDPARTASVEPELIRLLGAVAPEQ